MYIKNIGYVNKIPNDIAGERLEIYGISPKVIDEG